jgi:hypothetical protein
MKERSRLLTATLVATLIASAIGFFIVFRVQPDAAIARAAVDVGLLIALLVTLTSVLKRPAAQREDLIEMLRALARGEKERRVDSDLFGDLSEVARAANDVGAFLSEYEDPNLGPVKTRKRSAPRYQPPPEGESVHPELGEVRVIPKDELERRHGKRQSSPPEPADDDGSAISDLPSELPSEISDARTPISDLPSEVRDLPSDISGLPSGIPDLPSEIGDASVIAPAPDSEPPEDAESEPPVAAEDSGDDARDDAQEDAASEVSEGGEDVSSEDDNPTVIDRAQPTSSAPAMTAEAPEPDPEPEPEPEPEPDLEALFREFIEAKRAHNEDTEDIEYESFAETITDEMARLKEAHACRAVRFEVRVTDGEVSLLPRLLR